MAASSCGPATNIMTTRFTKRKKTVDPSVRLLIAYSGNSPGVTTHQEYLESFTRHSRFAVRYVHVTNDAQMDFDLNEFDVLFHSYCARLPFEGYVSPDYIACLKGFRGLKLLAVQDEYDETDRLRAAIRQIGFHVVFTCVPLDQVGRVYPPKMFPQTEFITVLTGYVPEAPSIWAIKPLPLHERPITIGYRGRDIGARYGSMAYYKVEIGRRMREICIERGIPYNIEWAEDKRIYGAAWYGFIGSCRAVLGTESGSNVFDFDGSIAAKYRQLSAVRGGAVPYEEFRVFTDPAEVGFDMGQISPRIFEAAAMRAPMILYHGHYSGAIQPGVHYIALAKDFSNIDAVLAQLSDFDALEAMAERTYHDLVASGAFSYRSFVEKVEGVALRKASELGIPLPRAHQSPLAVDSPIDLSSSFLEQPTAAPHHPAVFRLKNALRENNAYTAEIARLNRVYTAEIRRLQAVIDDLRTGSVVKALRKLIFNQLSRCVGRSLLMLLPTRMHERVRQIGRRIRPSQESSTQ
jgi:hypothetical protein